MASTQNDNSQIRSACTRVFAIAELADQILLDLPPQDILCGAQQACKQWKEAVEQSDYIQEHLFMKPICEKRVTSHPRDYLPKIWTDYEFEESPRAVLENPFLILLCHEGICTKQEAFMRPEASWRKMLMTQPAAREAVCNETEHILEAEDGVITLGDISDRLQGKVLTGIEAWWLLAAYAGPQQLKRVKVAMRSGRPCMVAGKQDDHKDEDDDLWWLPDEYLCGI
ncbi:hypothetical protein PRZ48_008273 [Zasmidium cellare]|uniref:F-box domain-containing protein n=1 Tax=Zasmidium cellare TaxID=395010 RepID=A0ABR0EF15_ZASCE|nr:hypothetical protein PRZ48_008273 [Zasmidium cellare]